MGILNVTPDSFSDGGDFLDRDRAVGHALEMVEEGADILDVGGESSRPGAETVTVQGELDRVIPVISAFRQQSDCLISIDTTKAEVARQAMDVGADIINDISALTKDVAMVDVARETGAGLVLMHMQGSPGTMQDGPAYIDVIDEVKTYLQARIHGCVAQGIDPACLAIDPGIGFGKTLEHNLQLLVSLHDFCELGHPVLVGLSRKSFLGTLTGQDVSGRLAGSLGALACCIEQHVHIMRVHDVKESCAVAQVVDKLVQAKSMYGVKEK